MHILFCLLLLLLLLIVLCHHASNQLKIMQLPDLLLQQVFIEHLLCILSSNAQFSKYIFLTRCGERLVWEFRGKDRG